MESLDPRVGRLGIPENWGTLEPKSNLDQLETFEVFSIMKENKPFTHVGIVHAPDEEMALVFAKEQYGRRDSTLAMCIANSSNVLVSPFTDNNQNLYDFLEPSKALEDSVSEYQVFHLYKRGKQHQHVGEAEGKGYEDALNRAKEQYDGSKPVLNIWLIKSEHLLSTDEEDAQIWATTPEKKFREATDYRAADKIKRFKQEKA